MHPELSLFTQRKIPYCVVRGDCRDVLPDIPSCSIDSVVCDPPYEIGMMSKEWDKTGVAYDVSMWAQVLRVLKPGGHLLSFGGTRTYHRMASAIEDAGFEIRDKVDVFYDLGDDVRAFLDSLSEEQSRALQRIADQASPLGFISWVYANGFPKNFDPAKGARKAGLSGLALKVDGMGTALKPANEPICLARKPLEGTLVENLEKWGTGALNVEAARVPVNGGKDLSSGRWPSNVVLLHSEECGDTCIPGCPVGEMDSQGGYSKTKRIEKPSECGGNTWHGTIQIHRGPRGYTDEGGASRFFYCKKAGGKERKGNPHPTVKPLSLIEYCVQLVTPPGGIVMDHFAGSGTTLEAGLNLGFRVIGIEKEVEYAAFSRLRAARALRGRRAAGE